MNFPLPVLQKTDPADVLKHLSVLGQIAREFGHHYQTRDAVAWALAELAKLAPLYQIKPLVWHPPGGFLRYSWGGSIADGHPVGVYGVAVLGGRFHAYKLALEGDDYFPKLRLAENLFSELEARAHCERHYLDQITLRLEPALGVYPHAR